jgi:hypothetical protein
MPCVQQNAVDLHIVGRVLNTRDYSRWRVGGTYRSCQKHKSLSLHDILSDGRNFLDVSFITRLTWSFCIALASENITNNNCITLHSQNTTALRPNQFTIGIRRLLVTNKGRSAFPRTNNWLESTAHSRVKCLKQSRHAYYTLFQKVCYCAIRVSKQVVNSMGHKFSRCATL